MRALSKRVYSGIRPPGAMHAQLLPEHAGESGLDPILNGVTSRLALPAREAGTLVGDDELEAPAAVRKRRR